MALRDNALQAAVEANQVVNMITFMKIPFGFSELGVCASLD